MRLHRVFRRQSGAAVERAGRRLERPGSGVALLQVLLMVLVAEASVALRTDE
jgi:hypothetical protein